jgi:hypothetical protein
MPSALPTIASSNASAISNVRTRETVKPEARRMPICRSLCSTPRRKKSSARSSAEATMKKLK